jgi:hypothetical protein
MQIRIIPIHMLSIRILPRLGALGRCSWLPKPLT